MVVVVVVVVIHAGPGRVAERAGRMLPVVVLMVLSFARERQHGVARGQVLPAPLLHAAARPRVTHPALQKQIA